MKLFKPTNSIFIAILGLSSLTYAIGPSDGEKNDEEITSNCFEAHTECDAQYPDDYEQFNQCMIDAGCGGDDPTTPGDPTGGGN